MSAIRWVDPRDGEEVELVEFAGGVLTSCTQCLYRRLECPHHGHGGPSCGSTGIWRHVAAPTPAAGAAAGAAGAGAGAPDGYRVNADRTAAVALDTTWRSDMDRCPRGVRVLLLVADGCAVIGEYRGEAGFEAWHPLPRRAGAAAGAGEGGE